MANVGGRPTKYEYMKETRKLSTLKNWDKNPRSIKDKDFERLKTQIRDLGQYKPLLITDDGTVLGGNMRLRAYNELGVEDVWVSVVDAPTEEKKLEYALSDNDRAGFYDEDLLANLIPDYPDFEWEQYAVDLGEPQTLDKLIDSFKEAEEDEVPEVAGGEPESKLGEVYQLGRHRLMCGDATKIEDVEKLMNGQKADMVFTDPPYGNGESGKYGRGQLGVRTIEGDSDFSTFESVINLQLAKSYIFFLQWRTLEDAFISLRNNNMRLRTVGVWDKKNAGLNGAGGISEQWEAIVFAGEHEYTKFGGNVFSESREYLKRVEMPHPHMKPIRLLADILSFIEGSLLLDPFGGSGSTLIACEQTNRTCYMMELDPKYCDVIRKRYENFINKTG